MAFGCHLLWGCPRSCCFDVRVADVWKQLFPAEQQRIAQLLIERVDFKDGSLDIHWREDGWIGLDPSIVAHPYVEESKEYAQEVMA